MNMLDKLYAERDTFLKYGQNVPADLAKAIKEAEAAELDNYLEMFKGYLPEEIDAPNIEKIIFAAEYDNDKLTRIAITSDVNKLEAFDMAKAISSEAEDTSDIYIPDDDKPEQRRSTSIGFSVHFADGKVIAEKTAHRTMIEALRYMGLERASHFNETFKGYPLIGTKQRITPDGNKWQQYVDGWWIYTNLSNERKIKCINGVSKMLNIPLEIVLEDDTDTITPDKPRQRNKRAMYSLNGGIAFCKNRSVLNVVRQFLSQISNASFKDVCDFFPRELQGSYGVVRSIEDIKQRGKTNKTEKDRWFLEPEEILTAADGIRFAVSNEWGDNFANFQKHVANNLGWELKEV